MLATIILLSSCPPASRRPSKPEPLSKGDTILLKNLISVVRATIVDAWKHGPPPTWQDYPYTATERGIIVRFVDGKTPRGCLAFYKGVDDLERGARIAALNAAFHDPRYAPLQETEARTLDIEACIIGKLMPMSNPMDFMLGKELVYMLHPQGTVLMQPSLARDFSWNKKEFLEALCQKEGLPQNAWQDPGVRFFRASIQELREPFILEETQN